MKITAIEITRISIPFDAHRRQPDTLETPYNAASPSLKRMETLLVKVITEDGSIGWGEAFGHLSNPVTEQALISLVAPLFLQRTVPASQQEISEMMQSTEQALHAFGRSGPVRYALSALDIALWDLLGKRQQKPLWQLLGATRSQIERYASLVSYGNDAKEVTTQIQRAYAEGYRTLKLHETHPAAIAAARQALPPGVDLMVDVNCPWSREQAQANASELRPLQLGWLEEPIWPPDDFLGLSQLRKAGVPLAAGENVEGDIGFVNLFESGAVDVAQPSVAKVGGITSALRVFKLARQYRVKVVPHCFYYGAGMLATAHLVAALPDDVKMEIPWITFEAPLYPSLPQNVCFGLSDAPGLGYEPDPAVLWNYRLSLTRIDQQGVSSHV
ncbi:D-galactonate dehydratase [Serratia ficaria]|uniref:mandelate racemase/muconate lactonizing enzyme family protein n=1 Tax=Serratia ficaria TaxID=61651 RepID=UPI00217C1FA9|nr:mandelate racemase/muconate lactonizing enzyme family protein [Serratia ficaria]CAI0855679.1 D-galactonate dehydratase [Serratia ficaria]CAI1165254.1 D-galactonate dehydratase [Serratia ficaria]CAI1967437.1 D-galactonate dehydratase [Serratia ficaria]CAI2491406.1 D-galactonate dehydratase [Serratia ficaria]CAI2525182.1 D-galactonate dehydratase [Serratia ficaria]